MKSKDIKTIYNHANVESGLCDFWIENKLFDPILTKNNKKNFSIILPPPNRTGQLHLGHAWDGSIQDLVIRYKKLCGYNTLWIPGTDHAGIATQTKYEQILKNQNIDPKTLEPSVLYRQIYDWAGKQAQYIHNQWKIMGFGLSYPFETYTLDTNVADLVNKSFIHLYEKGLIYKKKKLVNWDVILKTPVSDIEVIKKPTNSKLYFIKYLIVNTTSSLTIATTRPETMFGDVALFVNPKDKRYQKYIGSFAINPVNDQKLPILADEYIDMNFGTGVMKCTPAHDFNDYTLAQKHNISNYVSIMNENGVLNAYVPKQFVNIDRLKARPLVVDFIKVKGLLEKIDEHQNEIGYSERTNAIIEPLLSEQWFVKMKPIVADCRKVLLKDKCIFLPIRFTKTMNQWFDNIEDWCISRQLIWGHRLPVWYHKDNGKMLVGQPKNMNLYKQEALVFDTWYSSGLWPLVTTIYAKNTQAKSFFPISLLVTGYDILFFWVARMLFQCININKQTPIKKVYFHGLIRDALNRKMSKSLGNGIDPIAVIKKYGADALRTFLTSTSSIGEDIRFDEKKIQFYWSFYNKLWNAHNYLLQYKQVNITKVNHLLNKWIINEFNTCLKNVTKHLNNYNFVLANKLIIEFTWEILCNKYLEMIKPFLLKQNNAEFCYVLLSIYKYCLILIHPTAPFVTERIYQNIYTNKKSILLETWPKSMPITNYSNVDVISYIWSIIRDLRIKNGIKNDVNISVCLLTKTKVALNDLKNILAHYNITLCDKKEQLWIIHTGDKYSFAYLLPITNNTVIDINKQKQKLEFEIQRSKTILSNKQFLERAPKPKIEQEKEKLKNYLDQYKKLSHDY